MEIGAAYIRVSTNDQLEYSPDAQRKAILKYAKDNDIIISNENIFIDEGISGRKAEKRPAFMEMIKQSKSKDCPWTVIIVHKFDRFARNREDSIVYKSLLKKEHGIRVESICEQISDDKTGVILEAFMEAMAEYYSLNLSEEVVKGMSEKASRGEWNSGAPFGYRLNEKKLEIYEPEAIIVRNIFDMYVNKNIPIITITRTINDTGIKTRRNNKFEARTIRYILRNETYIGTAHWNPNRNNMDVRCNKDYDDVMNKSITVENSHPSIVDKDVFNKANERLRMIKPRTHTGEMKHWLTGILKCSNCGASLTRSTIKGFQCYKYSHGTCGISHYVSVNIIENAIFNALEEIIRTSADVEYTVVQDKDGDDMLKIYKRHLQTIADKEKRIKDAYISGIDTIEEYKEYKAKLDAERAEVKRKIEDIETKDNTASPDIMHNRICNVYDVLKSDNATMEEKNYALNSICSKIVYQAKKKNIELFFICKM